MQNWEGVLRATDLALNSSGSAMQENTVFQESLQGRVNQLNSAFSKFANESLESDFVSAVLQSTTATLNFMTAIGGLPTVLTSVAIAFALLNAQGIKAFVGTIIQGATAIPSFISSLISTGSATTALTTVTGGATVAVTALKVAMGGFIALGIMGVIFGVTKAFDALNVTVEEQTEKVNKLQTSYDELQTKINELQGKQDKTVTEERYLSILEQQLEIQKQQIEAEKELLALKIVTGKGEWFSEGKTGELEGKMTAINEQIRIYNHAMDMAEKNKDDPFQFEAHSKNAQTAKDRMLEFASEGTQAYQEILKYISLLPEEEKASAQQLLKDYDAMMKSLEEYGIGQKQAEQTTTEATETTNQYALVLKDLKDSMESLEETTDYTVSAIELLNSAIAKQSNGMSLSASEVDKLLKRYPSLYDAVVQTADGYYIDIEALQKLRVEAADTFQTEINGSVEACNQVIADCQKRIMAYKAELTALNALKAAWGKTAQAKLNADGGLGALSNQSVRNLTGLTDVDPLESKIKEMEDGITDATSAMDEASSALSKLNSEAKRVEIASSNLGNEIKSVGEKAKKSKKEIKDYADEITKLGKTIKEAQTQLAEFKKGFDLFKGGYVNDAFREQKLSIAELEEGYKSAKAELEKLVEQYNVLKKNTKGDEAKKKLDELNDKIKEQTTLIGNLTSQAKAYNDELKSSALETLRNERQGLNDILSQTIELIKYEKNLEKEKYEEELKQIQETNKAQQEALKERVESEKEAINTQLDSLKESVDERKKLIKEESDAQKKALKDQLSAYQDIINKRKEALEKQEEEKSYQEKLAEEQTKLIDMQQKLQELKNASDTAEGRASYLEQLEKVKEQEKVITDLQREWEIKQQKNTLDQMLEEKEDNINSQLEAVEDAYDKEDKALDDKLDREEKKLKEQLKYWESYLDAETKKLEDSLKQQEEHYQSYIDEINKYLKEEGTIRLDAMREIETNSESLYNRLIEYNKIYGTGVSKDIVSAWDLATEALRKYADAQGSVLSAMGKIDALEDYMGNEDNSVKVNEKDNDKITTEKPKTENTLSDKAKQQLNQQKYLHNQMVIAKNTANKQLENWIKQERKKWGDWVNAPFIR